MTSNEEQPLPTWGWWYLGLWGLWAVGATAFGIAGDRSQRDWWWLLAGTFGVLEAVGALAHSDRAPMLTEVFGRYVPGWLLFSVLAIAMWRLSHWVPGPILWAGSACQLFHFIQTYHSYQKLGGYTPPLPPSDLARLARQVENYNADTRDREASP
jgi:hypothetical protein